MADFQRLPHTVLPVVYDLHITPDLKELTFQGFVKITVDVKEETKVVKVNAAELAIQKVIFSTNENDDGAVSAASIELNEKDEVATVTFDANLPLGKGFLSYTYTGILNDQMKGFYRSKYVVGEEERWAGVTQFEATDARRALPSWDEPAIKAQFDVTLTVPKDRVALSNMPVIKEEVNGEVKTLKFDRTPIMSTYLLAFVVGEFDYIEQYTADGRIAVRVYTPLGKTDQGRFALDVAVRTLPYYEQWFGIEYPLPKADLIAIADFSAGAMENWGLITYRETALLVDPNSSSTSTKQWVALVVGHELAHQWFGNLVTMEWWTHLWLNEGFASWIEYLCVDYCFPEWNIWTQFITQDANNALSLDAMKSSHPIEVEVKHPSEIDEIFDSITYSKGSTVIRMLAGFLGEDVFKKALNLYLNRHKFSNTFTEDLWAAFEETSGKPVRELMDTWTKQMGFPVISVDEIEPGKYAIEQSRFLANEVASGADADFLWLVPVGAISEADSTEHFTVLKERKGVFEIPSVTQEGQWVKINPNQTGYYRVNYSARLLQQLKRGLTSNAIKNATDRLELQNDLFALARASIASTTSVLDFLSAYPDETDYTVWSDIAANLSSVTHLLSFNPEHKGIANKFGADLFRKVVASVGWEATPGESAQTSLLRPLVIRQLGKFGDATIIAEAKARLAQFAADKVSLAADLRAAVYGIALQYGGKEEYDTIFKIFEETDLQEEKVRCLRSFGASADPELLQKTLELALTPKVRSQDAVFVILSVASNPAGRQLAWDFFKANVNVFIEKYNGGFLLGRLAKGVVDGFASEEKALEAIQFFEQNPIASAKRAVDQAIETVRTNAKWIERDLDSIVSWFKQYSNSQ